MKKILNIGLIATAFLGLLLTTSCKDDESVDNPQLNLEETRLAISKTGFTYQGETPSINVTSNVYWTLAYSDASPSLDVEEPWLRVSQVGGTGSVELEFNITPNTDTTPRSVKLLFVTNQGLTETLEITQAGDTEELLFYSDSFGNTNASMVELSDYKETHFSGVGVEGFTWPMFRYSGAGAYYDSENKSDSEGASGGNNILLQGRDSYMTLEYIRSLNELDFLLSFTSAASGGSFGARNLAVEISSEGRSWYPMEYTRSSGPGWEASVQDFSLSEAYTYLYIRFTNKSDGDIYLDDIKLEEGVPSGNIFTLDEKDLSFVGVGSFPVYWNLTTQTKALNELTFGVGFDSYYVWSQGEGQAFRGISKLSWEVNGRDFDGRVEIDGNGMPTVSRVIPDDHWLFSIPVSRVEAGDVIYMSIPTYISASGMKYWALEIQDGGVWKYVSEPFTAPESEDIVYTHIATTTNTSLQHFVTMDNPLVEDTLKVRLRCVALLRADNGNSEVSGGTSRISGTANNKPIIAHYPGEIDIDDVEIKVEGITHNSLTYAGMVDMPTTFRVTSNYYWEIETSDLDWLDISPTHGLAGMAVTVSTMPEMNEEGIRTGTLTIVSGGKRHDIAVMQSGAGSEMIGLPQTVNCNSLSNSNAQGLSWLGQQILNSDDGRSAIQYVKHPNNASDASQPAPVIDVSGSQPRITQAVEEDYWLWTIPVLNAAANTELKITGGLRSSGNGPRYLLMEWSVDGTNWTEVEPREEQVTISGRTVTARYTDQMSIPTSDDGYTFELDFTITEPVTRGNYYLRFTISTDINQSKNRFQNRNTGTGTHRVTRTWVLEQR